MMDSNTVRDDDFERRLIEAARAGDAEAFIDLVRARADRLFAIANRILRDVTLAEDAVQDALVAAWRRLPELRDPGRFDAWLRRILVHAALDVAGRERRHAARLRVLPIDPVAPYDDLPGLADRDALERGFRRLPPDHRVVLVLHHYLGYAPSEIAETLGIPAGTVRSRLHNAHRSMRAVLEADARPGRAGGRSA